MGWFDSIPGHREGRGGPGRLVGPQRTGGAPVAPQAGAPETGRGAFNPRCGLIKSIPCDSVNHGFGFHVSSESGAGNRGSLQSALAAGAAGGGCSCGPAQRGGMGVAESA